MMDEIEKHLAKIERNNQIFRIGVILSLCGLLLLSLGEMSLYNGASSVLRWTNEMAICIGGCAILFGLGLIILTTLGLERVYGIGE